MRGKELKGGKPLKRYTVSAVLKDTLKHMGKNSIRYNTHSLRIGRGTDMFERDVNREKIKQFGRWSSDAYVKYIKPAKIVCN